MSSYRNTMTICKQNKEKSSDDMYHFKAIFCLVNNIKR